MEDNLYVECACHSPEHLIKFSRFKDDEDKEVYLHVFLTNDGFFKRVIKGLKYIFGYKCRYGHFSEIVLNETAQKQIVDFLAAESHNKSNGFLPFH